MKSMRTRDHDRLSDRLRRWSREIIAATCITLAALAFLTAAFGSNETPTAQRRDGTVTVARFDDLPY